MPTSEADRITLSDFCTEIFDSLVKSELDHKDCLPEGNVSQLVTEDRVRSLLPRASTPLVKFVCLRARKVFLTILWCREVSEDDLMSIMGTFKDFDMTDNHLPIDDITAKDGTCKVRHKEKCTHDKALDVFHAWEARIVSRFHKEQWTFCPPVFKTNKFQQQELKAGCILPFTWVSKDRKDGYFGTVFKATLHANHHQDDSELTGVRRHRDSLDESFCTDDTTGRPTRGSRCSQGIEESILGIGI